MSLISFLKSKFKPEPAPKQEPEPDPVPVKPDRPNEYEFIIKCVNEKSQAQLEKYQAFWTDPEDRYNGMTMWDLKDSALYGEKVYEYPPRDVDVKLSAFIGEDGSVQISGYVLDADGEIYVGKAARTKAKKILRILQDESPSITGELYGGKYWILKDNGYVDDDWSDILTVRIYFRW